jgi:hypothetical protein
LHGGGQGFESPRLHSEKPLVQRVFTPNQVFNVFILTLLSGVSGGQVGVKSAPFVSSRNLSNFCCNFSACRGLVLFNSCISRGHDSRALSAV